MQADQKIKMENLFESAFNRTSTVGKKGDEVDEVKVVAQLREINTVGSIFIDFSPQVVAVPNDWEELWDLA